MESFQALIIAIIILFSVFTILAKLIVSQPYFENVAKKGEGQSVKAKPELTSDQHVNIIEKLNQLEQRLIPIISMSEKHEKILSGSQSKGALGELVVEQLLDKLPHDWYSRNVPLPGGTIEFALRTPNKRWIPIDSQWTAPEDLMIKLEQSVNQAQRNLIRREVHQAVDIRAQSAMKYLDKDNTLGFCIVAVPDFVFNLCVDIQPNLASRNIVLISHSLLVPYILLIVNQYLKNIQTTDSLQVSQILSRSAAEIELIQRYILKEVAPTLELAGRQQSQFVRQNQGIEYLHKNMMQIQESLNILREMVSPVPNSLISTIPQRLHNGLNHVKDGLLENIENQNRLNSGSEKQ